MPPPSFFSVQYHFVYRPFMKLASILSFIVSKLSDKQRAAVGRFLVKIITRYNFATLPTADELTKDNTVEVSEKVKKAMDAIGPDGKPGGWLAGKAVIEEARKPGAALNDMPEGLMVTIFMGLPGRTTPQTSFLATQLLHSLKQKYYETGQPDYLFAQAIAIAEKELRKADEWGGCLGGVLQAMFDARKDPTPPLGWRARELLVLTGFRQFPEYIKFLTVEDDGDLSLPRGKSYEEFAAAMLANAYGPYPAD